MQALKKNIDGWRLVAGLDRQTLKPFAELTGLEKVLFDPEIPRSQYRGKQLGIFHQPDAVVLRDDADIGPTLIVHN